MSKRVTRRGLLGGLVDSLRDEPSVEPSRQPRPSFSLEAFYASREPPSGELPVVVVREGLPQVETSAVGVCPPIEVRDAEGGIS